VELGLEGKVAFVTGASSGLGFALASELAREGANVIICSRDQERVRNAASSLSAQCGRAVLSCVADTSNEGDRTQLLSWVRRNVADPDILVINSGGPPAGPFESHAPERWVEAINQHLGAAVHLARETVPAMRARQWGRILTITSVSLKQPASGMILSNTARAAVLGFARTLANEVAKDRITVNNLMPGYTLTDRIDVLSGQIAKQRGVPQEKVIAQWEAEIPMGRLGTAEEFAALGVFLCSSRASYITGTSIPVDGGWIKAVL
jgi:3-oxoacyl-[acyl-carrier protein] reductase